MNLSQTPIDELLFPRPKHVQFRGTEARFSKKQWNILYRLFASTSRELSVVDACEYDPILKLEPVWDVNRYKTQENMRNTASKINDLLRKMMIPMKVRFHKDGMYFELVALDGTSLPPPVMSVDLPPPSESYEKTLSYSLMKSMRWEPGQNDDIITLISPVLDDIFARKNDIGRQTGCDILIAVVNNASPSP